MGETPYKCIVCDAVFIIKSGHTKHLRKHTGVKAYSCKECSTKFFTVGTLKVYERVLMRMKPYI